ncbi:MAG: 3-deoxy-D-manno-octulosonic acid transferase [Chlamydiales bacterium]
MIFLYNLGIHFFACFRVLSQWRKYRGLVKAKLGQGFPEIKKGNRVVVWVHAVSMGETKAIAPLIEKMKSLTEPPLIILSTATQSGHEEGKKGMADYKVYLPFDFPYIIRPIIRRLSPDLVILTETDFWYHFQDAAKKSGATLVVVNAKLSQRSFARYQKFPFLIRYLLHPIDYFYVQGALYQERIHNLGIPLDKMSITGNIKLDVSTKTIPTINRKNLGLNSHFVITLGSTHPPEEEIWIRALKKLWQDYPELKVLIAPRHPERFEVVAHLLKKESLNYTSWSEQGTLDCHNILLIDAMGILNAFYQISDLAFVGGSFTPAIGGHNILEPCFYGKPVLFGPHMDSQPDLVELMLSYSAGIQITPKDIYPTLRKLISNPTLCHKIGENGLHLLHQSRGAMDKTFNALRPLIEKRNS